MREVVYAASQPRVVREVNAILMERVKRSCRAPGNSVPHLTLNHK